MCPQLVLGQFSTRPKRQRKCFYPNYLINTGLDPKGSARQRERERGEERPETGSAGQPRLEKGFPARQILMSFILFSMFYYFAPSTVFSN